MERHVIDMDGITHGAEGSGADCEHDGGLKPHMGCGFNCGKCGIGVVHWQPIWGGYYYQCDCCDHSASITQEFSPPNS